MPIPSNTDILNGVTSAFAPGGAGSPAGDSGALQFNNAGAFGGALSASIGPAGCLIISGSADTTNPAPGSFKFDTTPMAGRVLPHVRDMALGNTLQPHMGRNSVADWTAAGGGTIVGVWGASALTVLGTVTTANWASTSRLTRIKRVEWLITTAAVGALASFRTATNHWSIGAAPNHGGFHSVCLWYPATGVATMTQCAFNGFSAIGTATAPTDVNPSTLTSMCGMGWDAADANIQFMHAGATGGTVKVSTTLPVPTTDRPTMYEVMMFSPAGSATLYWSIVDLTTLTEATGSVTDSTRLPANTISMGYRSYVSSGGATALAGIGLARLYIETDF